MVIVKADKIKHTPWKGLDGIKNKKVQKAWVKFIKENPNANYIGLDQIACVRIFAESVER